MKHLIGILCVMLFTLESSCTKSVCAQELNLDAAKVQFEIEIPSFKDSAEIRYSDIFSNVRYVELEAKCNDAYISFITHMEITNDNDIIVLDFNNKKVLRFDSNGHFLNLIGEAGHGHNEYLYPRSIAYDKYENQILVWDVFAQKILYYNLDGAIKKSIKLGMDCSEIKVIDKNHLILFLNYNDNTGFNYLVIDKEGKECFKFEKIPHPEVLKSKPTTTYALNNSDNGGILCRAPYSSTMYRVDGQGAIPFLRFVPKEKNWLLGKPEDISKLITLKKPSCINASIIVKGKLFLTGYIPTQKSTYVLCHDLQKKTTRCGKNFVNDMNGFLKHRLYKQHKGGDIYFLIYPDDFRNLLDSWKDRTDIPQKDREFVTKMANSTNPIIQICTVKD